MRRICLFVAMALAIACEPTDNGAVQELSRADQPFRTALDGDHEHDEITRRALSFVSSQFLTIIANSNEGTDTGSTQKQSAFHVDNCRAHESARTIMEHYEQAIAALNPSAPRTQDAARIFGIITHIAQDFYAHSNWTEGAQGGNIALDELQWPRSHPGERLGNMIVLGPNLPAGWILSRASGSRVPTVQTENGRYLGWISGTYADNVDPSVCPSSVAIEHGRFIAPQWQAYDSFLAKDAPQSPHHDEAAALAVRQTAEEFCRLDRLVSMRYGARGHDLLMDWMIDRNRFSDFCPKNAGMLAALMTL